jgi:hypothetical protein
MGEVMWPWLEKIFDSIDKPIGGLTPLDLFKLWVVYKVLGVIVIWIGAGLFLSGKGLWEMITG